ncbi:WSC-domain-containing protein [Poronia punctata]|nr:WSC-domain-containing protein [Poronia punctata]
MGFSDFFGAIGVLVGTAANFEGNNLAPGLQVGGWQYLGCINEVPGRALAGTSWADNDMTIERCQSYCKLNNFPLAGVEYSRECFCGKRLIAGAHLGQPDCNMECRGNNKQICGGSSRVSVFNNTKFISPGAAKTLDSWEYQSCYMEPMGMRALPNLIAGNDRMTVEMCVQACQDNNYNYAGLEYGRECWCGTTVSNDLEDASDPNCSMQCDMMCAGNERQICGGRATISIYRSKNANSKRDLLSDTHTLHGHSSMRAGARKGRYLKVQEDPLTADQES